MLPICWVSGFGKALSLSLEHKFAQSVLNSTVKTAFLHVPSLYDLASHVDSDPSMAPSSP